MNKKTIHRVNVILGVLFFGFSLFLAWFGLVLVPVMDTTSGIIIPVTILSIWLIAYYLQIKFRTSVAFLFSVTIELVVLAIIIMQVSQQFGITITV
ncbi:hypothetical protein [Virgibacillus siamensis]|uniref:hypothetical protein n=1 Tax=Virgibacillus siamensis TaxID=480071 RepID=UPI0009856C72|nr:hypothetical protein [Virgibacillus siamensis]